MKFFNLLAIVALTSAIKLEKNEAPAVQELSQTSLDVTEGGVGGKKKKNKGKGKGKGKKLRGNGVEEADATLKMLLLIFTINTINLPKTSENARS